MVNLTEVKASNARIRAILPSGLVAVFVGATSGIGETSMKQFAKQTLKPRIYFVGRSQEAGDRITGECKALNSEGQYTFIKADVSLLKIVDEVCREVRSKEQAVNLLFLSQGTLQTGAKTAEGLHYPASLAIYSRNRFILNLLPCLRRAPSLRRVISVFVGSKEGPINTSDLQMWSVPLMAARGHGASMATLSYEALAQKAPTVAFVHSFPGPVKSGIARDTKGLAMFTFKAMFALLGPLLYIPNEESGERHLYLCTSGRYPAREGVEEAVSVEKNVGVARGTDGAVGGGVYSVDQNGEGAGVKVREVLAGLREKGVLETVWKDSEEQFKRITGEVVMA